MLRRVRLGVNPLNDCLAANRQALVTQIGALMGSAAFGRAGIAPSMTTVVTCHVSLPQSSSD